MALDNLHERFDHFASLSDEVQLFWTMLDDAHHDVSQESNGSDHDEEDTGILDSIHLAVAYLLPAPSHHDDGLEDDEYKMNYWLGFGLSPQGGMIGSDMMIFLPPLTSLDSDENSTGFLLDANGIAYSFPEVDKCGQDWHLLKSYLGPPISKSDDELWHIVEAKRALKSNDVNEDVPFVDDSSNLVNPTYVVAAWGLMNFDGAEDAVLHNKEIDLFSVIVPHGPSSRVSAAVSFFGTTAGNKKSKEDGTDDSNHLNLDDNLQLEFIDLVPEEPFRIPDQETTYKNFCFQVQDYPSLMNVLEDHEQVHIVAFHDIVGRSSLVHHMDLHGTTSDILGSDKRLCRVYMDLIHPWEAGSPQTFELPSEAGIPLGKDGYRAFRVEVHYHNPLQDSGLMDQSGVRLYYSVAKRPHVAGLMLLGDSMLELRGSYTVGSTQKKNLSSPNAAGMRHSFYCPPSCFTKNRLGVGTDGNASSSFVTVFREVLHMHKSGERMTNIHLDANGTIMRASEANRFDFSRGAGYTSRVGLPYRINEGDSFVSTCYFATRGVLWGSSSDDEMCQTFIWYYPKKDYSLTCGYFDPIARKQSINSIETVGCEMGYDRKAVLAETDLERLRPDEKCQAAELSKRSVSSFEPLFEKDLQSWPSLLQLVNTWKQSLSRDPNNPINDTSSKSVDSTPEIESKTQPNEICHLCPDGQRPTQPDIIIEGFSWTCDELDAAVPVLYIEPQLLYFSEKDVAPCKDYHASYGELCGCPVGNDVKTSLLTPKTGMIMADRTLGAVGILLMVASIFVFTRHGSSFCSPVLK